MDSRRKKKLERAGWRLGDAREFLELTPEEAQFIELKLALSQSLRAERLRQGLTQSELAKLLKSSQPRVAMMEGGDPSVTVDLLLRALLLLGLSKRDLSRIIAKPAV